MPQIFRMGEYWIYNSHIPTHTLRNIMRMIEARNGDVISKWLDYFGEIRYFC